MMKNIYFTQKFKYFTPRTVQEACSLLSKFKNEAKVVAGGTDIISRIKRGEVRPKYIINVGTIPDQDYVTYDEKEGLRLGVLATIHSIASSSLIREKFSILAQAASNLGTVQIRNQATVGGNLCNAAPSAEMAPTLIALNARAKIIGTGGGRVIPVEDFFTGPGQTVLMPDEMLVEIQVPNLLPRSSGIYIKQTTRKALDLAVVGVAVVVTMDKSILEDVKIALGAVSPIPIRAKMAEEILRGKKIKDDLLEKAGQIAADESKPITDVRGSADYRRKILKVLVGRAINQAVQQIELKQ